MKRFAIALLLLLIAATPSFASVPVSTTMQTSSGSAIGANSYMRMALIGCGSNIPRVIGSGSIVKSTANFYPSSGVVSGTIYGNDEIDCGGSSNTQWQVQFIVNNVPISPAKNYRVCLNIGDGCGSVGTFNPATAVPTTSIATVPPPTGDTTYARLDGGNSGSGQVAYKNAANTFIQPQVFPAINGIRYADQAPGADACAKINAAILASASTGAVVNAQSFTGYQTCNSNPFAGVTRSGKLLLGAATFQTTVKWQTPVGLKWTIEGAGRGDSGSHNTSIQAVAGFPTDGTPVIQIGGSTPGTATHGTTFQNLTVDCNGIATVGAFSADANEMSGLKRIDIANCSSRGFKFAGMASVGTAQNYVIDEVEIYPQSYGTDSTVCGEITGQSAGPQHISNTTCVANSSARSTNCFTIDNVAGGRFESLHGEQCTKVVNLGSSAVVDGISLNSTTGGPGTTTVIEINNANSQNIVALNTIRNGATNAIVNNVSGRTFVDDKLSLYVYGNGTVPRPELSISTGSNSIFPSAAFLGDINLNGHKLVDGTVIPASAGMVALGSTQAINFRNFANSGDVNGISKDASDVVVVGGAAGIKASSVNATGGIKAGASGSTIADTRELVQSVHSCGSTTTCANTPNLSENAVIGFVTLAAGTATVTGITGFTSTSSFVCVGTDQTTAAAVKISNVSASSITIGGTGTDVIGYHCIGN